MLRWQPVAMPVIGFLRLPSREVVRAGARCFFTKVDEIVYFEGKSPVDGDLQELPARKGACAPPHSGMPARRIPVISRVCPSR